MTDEPEPTDHPDDELDNRAITEANEARTAAEIAFRKERVELANIADSAGRRLVNIQWIAEAALVDARVFNTIALELETLSPMANQRDIALAEARAVAKAKESIAVEYATKIPELQQSFLLAIDNLHAKCPPTPARSPWMEGMMGGLAGAGLFGYMSNLFRKPTKADGE